MTPHFYDPVATPGTRYSFTGALKAPRQIMPGGYISWLDPEGDNWQQLRWIDPNGPRSSSILARHRVRACASGSMGSMTQTELRTTVRISQDPVNHHLLNTGRERRARLERMAALRAAQHFE